MKTKLTTGTEAPIEPQGSYNGQSEIERMKANQIDQLKPALPDFYVGMEIVAAENSAFHFKGATYEILGIENDELLITTNYSEVTHHVKKSEFFKRFGLKPNKNQPMKTIDPDELKPAKEWLKYLPEPIRTEALEACEKWPVSPDKMCNFMDCVNCALHWHNSGNYTIWTQINQQLQRGEITPVQPEEVKEERQTSPELVTYEEAINRLRAEVETTQKQNGKLQGEINFIKESMTQLRSKINPLLEQLKQERQTTSTPTPEPRKLPLTIEEVYSSRKNMIGVSSWFFKDNKVQPSKFLLGNFENEFRHESTAKKALAFLTLLKIAEAQNEMCERGDVVYCAAIYKAKGEIEIIVSTYYSPISGQIYFHSEQGLKDCIAANEQLFKDYLEIDN